MNKLKYSLEVLTVAASLAAAACGGSGSVSPAAPSGFGSTAAGGSTTGGNPSAGAVITGRVTGVTTSSAQLARTADGMFSFGGTQFAATTDPNAIVVTVVGTSTSTTVGPGGDFTLTGVPSGSVQLQFAGRGGNAMVTISGIQSTDRIEISVALSGSTAKVESENRRREDSSGVEVNGRVTEVGSGMLKVGTTVVTIPPTGVVIRHGSKTIALADIKVGDHVEVKGTKTTTGVTATEIKVESESDDDDTPASSGSASSGSNSGQGSTNSGSANSGNDDDEDDDKDSGNDKVASDNLKGAVASLGSSACPNLSFVIKGVTVTTSAATKFDGVSCATIKVGTSLEVKGTKTGTTLAATTVGRD